MIKIKIIRLKPEDARGVMEVYYYTWLATYPNKKIGITINDIKNLYKKWFDKKGKITKKGIDEYKKKILKRDKILKDFVAKIDHKIVGIARITIDQKYNKLSTIYILPEYQKKGIGRMLWNKCSKYINPKNQTFLHVASYNTNAINFYERLGFKKVGKIFYDKRFKMKSRSSIPEIKMVLKNKQSTRSKK